MGQPPQRKPTFGYVQVEEVTIEDRLNGTGKDNDQVVVALNEVAIQPVQQVQSPITAQRKQIVAGDALGFARLRDEEQLRQNRHRLQVNRECPQNLWNGKLKTVNRHTIIGRIQFYLHHTEIVIDQQCQNDAGYQQKLDAEGIVIVVVRSPELQVDEIDGGATARQEHHLHHRVV